MGWIKNIFSKKTSEEVIVLEEIVEESIYPENYDNARRKKDSIRDALNVRGELSIGKI